MIVPMQCHAGMPVECPQLRWQGCGPGPRSSRLPGGSPLPRAVHGTAHWWGRAPIKEGEGAGGGTEMGPRMPCTPRTKGGLRLPTRIDDDDDGGGGDIDVIMYVITCSIIILRYTFVDAVCFRASFPP